MTYRQANVSYDKGPQDARLTRLFAADARIVDLCQAVFESSLLGSMAVPEVRKQDKLLMELTLAILGYRTQRLCCILFCRRTDPEYGISNMFS